MMGDGVVQTSPQSTQVYRIYLHANIRSPLRRTPGFKRPCAVETRKINSSPEREREREEEARNLIKNMPASSPSSSSASLLHQQLRLLYHLGPPVAKIGAVIIPT